MKMKNNTNTIGLNPLIGTPLFPPKSLRSKLLYNRGSNDHKFIISDLKKYDLNLNKNKQKFLNKTEMILNLKNVQSLIPMSSNDGNNNNIPSIFNYKKNRKVLINEYLNSIFKFDRGLAKDKNVLYKFNNKKNRFIPTDNNISMILESYFLNFSSLISRPAISFTHNKVIIDLFYLLNKKKNYLFNKFSNSSLNISNIYSLLYSTNQDSTKNSQIVPTQNLLPFHGLPHTIVDPSIMSAGDTQKENGGMERGLFSEEVNNIEDDKNINLISSYLSKRFKKEVVLDLVRLYYPFFESKILSNAIAKISHRKRIPFIFIMDKILKNGQIKNPKKDIVKPKFSYMSTFLTGINLKLAGRLLSQKVIPRFTVKTAQQGTLSRGNSRLVLKEMSTKKNKRGTFTVSVSIGHEYF